MRQLPHADAIVVSCCWSVAEKHQLLQALAPDSTAPVFCLNDTPHGCGACTEADRFDPKALVGAIQQKLGMCATPATSDAPKPAVAAAPAATPADDQQGTSAQTYEIDALRPAKSKPASVHPKAQAINKIV